tara:strand:+ start:618 stop:1037 length:420 start_codon:yes stop_codon:yes gene_type:complete
MSLKIVKNKTLKKDFSKPRHDCMDSPLRYPMNVHMTDTHERRIDWLYFENYQMCEQYITAQLLYSLAKLKYKDKEKKHIDLKSFRAIKDAQALWKEVNFFGELYSSIWVESMKDSYKYHYVGDDEEELDEQDILDDQDV